MPKISERGEFMPASPIRKLVPYSEAAKRQGKKVHHLNIGQPDIKSPKVALDAVKNADLEILAYGHSAGNESYRRKLATYYTQFNVEVDYTDILITTGGSEGLFITMMSCLDAFDEVIVPEPFYANYYGFSTAGNIVMKPVTSHIEDGFALPPIADFEPLITPKTKAILLCNPSNPTGYVYSMAELLALKALVLKYDLFLLVDEVYREFVYGDTPVRSILELEGLDNHVVVVDSISKRYSACGARVGSIVSRNPVFIETALKFGQSRLCPPAFAQIFAEATLDVPHEYLDNVKVEYTKRRDLLMSRLQNMEGVLSIVPMGAFYTMVQLPVNDAEVFCRWMLEKFDHHGETVMLAPGAGFYTTKGLGLKEVRIAYVLNCEDLNRAMDCLEAALKVYPGSALTSHKSGVLMEI